MARIDPTQWLRIDIERRRPQEGLALLPTGAIHGVAIGRSI